MPTCQGIGTPQNKNIKKITQKQKTLNAVVVNEQQKRHARNVKNEKFKQK